MSTYRLVTVWRFEAPLELVYAAVCDPLRWPEWWPDARCIEQRAAGDANDVGQLLDCTWQSGLPFRLRFELLTTRIVPGEVVEGRVGGDLAGTGCCRFAQEGAITVVRHEWAVRTTPRWMNACEPLTHRLFKYNHARAMRHGGEGLARRLGVRPPVMTHEEIGAHDQAGQLRRACVAGLVAGVVATFVQLLLWRAAHLPVQDTLWRDIHLTAAILLGSPAAAAALPQTVVFLLAALVHAVLSCLYGRLFWTLSAGVSGERVVLAGVLFGAALYAVNLHGFTLLFPWFVVARGAITCVTHLAFGVVVGGVCLWLRDRSGRR